MANINKFEFWEHVLVLLDLRGLVNRLTVPSNKLMIILALEAPIGVWLKCISSKFDIMHLMHESIQKNKKNLSVV